MYYVLVLISQSTLFLKPQKNSKETAVPPKLSFGQAALTVCLPGATSCLPSLELVGILAHWVSSQC